MLQIGAHPCGTARTRRGGRLCPPARYAPANTDAPTRIRTTFVGVDAHIDPHAAQSFLRNVAANLSLPKRADRVVRPYRTFYVFAENACNFAIAFCRVDVGIDPYRQITLPPFVVCFCGCELRGRGRTPPLHRFGRFYACVVQRCYFRSSVSTISVTGPSLTDSTSICAPNSPCCGGKPRRVHSARNCS